MVRSFKFWDDIIKLPEYKKKIMNDKNVSFAKKIALFDCNRWPIMQYNKDFIANQQRLVGNDCYTSLQFEMAITAYNTCLRFCSSLEEKGIAYANRAAAYLALRSYQDCLHSVRLAKECPVPEKIMNKILAREKMAIAGLNLEGIERCADDSDIPIELSFRRNKHISSFAFCLAFKEAGNPYDGIVTTENLLPGDVLVVEPPLMRYADTNSYSFCDYCFRRCGSLQPCICGYVLFCGPKCKMEAFKAYHNYECHLMDHLLVFPNHDRLVIRIFFKLIQRFKDVPSLRKYLENIKTPNPFEGNDFEAYPDAGSFESQFRLYYATERPSVVNSTVQKNNLYRTDVDNKNLYTSMAKAAIIIDMLKDAPKTCNIPRAAKNEEEWSFLSEQLFRLIFYKYFAALNIPISKGITYVENDQNEIQLKPTGEVGRSVGSLHGSASLFRTSCHPNIYINYENNMLIVRTLKYLPRGTELLAINLTTVLNAYSLNHLFPSSSFDLSRACHCTLCIGWYQANAL